MSMTTIKKIYDKMPATIDLPLHLQNKRVEITIVEIDAIREKRTLVSFFGSIPDFPERATQGMPQIRDEFL